MIPNLGSQAVKLLSVGLLLPSPSVKTITKYANDTDSDTDDSATSLEESSKNLNLSFDDNLKKINPVSVT